MNIRRFKPSDAKQVAKVFHDTVREVNRRDYTGEQVEAWAPDDLNFRDWVAECSKKYTIVAEKNRVILGFGELESDGHIDCFYIHKDYQPGVWGEHYIRRWKPRHENGIYLPSR